MTQDAAPLIRARDRDVPVQEIVTPLSARALFWRPRYLRSSGLLHHLPFLFWLADMQRPNVALTLGLGDGVGYFGLCQAMDRLGAAGRCHGLDGRATEDGGPDAEILSHHAADYADFAQLHREDPRDAAELFDDAAIDLLLIDRDLDDDLVRNLTQDWLQKLSDRAVILLHGTADRFAAGPGKSLLQDLSHGSPVVHLNSGQGLAAVLYGPNRLDKLERLAELGPGQAGHAEVHHVFARLGAANVHEDAARSEAARADAARSDADAAKARLANVTMLLEAREAAVESRAKAEDSRADQLASLQARLSELQTAHDARAEESAAHARSLAEVEATALREAASRDVALIRERDRAETLARQLAAAEAEARKMRAETETLAGRLADAETGIAAKDRALELATERLDAAREAEADLAAQLEQANQVAPEPVPVSAPVDETRHADEIRVLTTRLEATQQEVLTLQRELRARGDQSARMADLERDLDAAHQHVADLHSSTSWRVTRPLRGIRRMLRRGG